MLRSIIVDNFALFKHLELNFRDGLCIISGETGSGKSILVQAISALTGENISLDKIRSRETTAAIEGHFLTVGDSEIQNDLASYEIDFPEDGIIMLRREIKSTGRNRYLINDHVVPKKAFQAIGKQLLDISSQHEHQILLDSGSHMKLLDLAADLNSLREKTSKKYTDIQSAGKRIRELFQREKSLNQRRKLLEYQLQEIDDSKLVSGEKQSLVKEAQVLKNADDIRRNVDQTLTLCEKGDVSIAHLCRKLIKISQRIVHKDENFNDLYGGIEALSLMCDDIVNSLSCYRGSIIDSPDRLKQVSERLHYLQDLEGKYRSDIDGILEYRHQIDEELSQIENVGREIEQEVINWPNICSDYLGSAEKLSRVRKVKAKELDIKIVQELKKLGMEKVVFETTFSEEPCPMDSEPGSIPAKWSASGIDSLTYLMSANPGSPLKPLAAVASGGELSRIMLALKLHFKIHSNTTLILDEVDAGIGGRTATEMGKLIRQLSEKHQVFCVTHLPQIAANGEYLLKVTKSSTDQDTTIQITELSGTEKVSELARMLAGQESDIKAQELAESMLRSD